RTRGALVALFVGLLAAAVFEALEVLRRERRARGRARFLPILAGGAIVVASLFLSEPGRGLLERFGSIDALGEDPSSAARWRTVKLSWQLFAEHPLLGVGPGGYAVFVESEGLSWSHVDAEDPRLPGTRRFNLEFTSAAQNQLSQLAAETGALGLVVFAVWCAVALRTLQRARASGDPQLATFFAGAELYVIAVVIGTQSTCYLMDKSSIAYLLFLVVGMADRVVGEPRRLPASAAPAVPLRDHERRPAYAVPPGRVA
ncbi:MAG: O-antigen ligase family protein, partial [Thermodesulfobacteriota bacterium]